MEPKVIKNRILQVLDEKHISVNKLAGGDATLSRKLTRQFNNDTELSVAAVILLLKKFPDLRTEWLFRGEGEPFRTGEPIEDQLAAIQERLSALEGERKNDNNQETMAEIA